MRRRAVAIAVCVAVIASVVGAVRFAGVTGPRSEVSRPQSLGHLARALPDAALDASAPVSSGGSTGEAFAHNQAAVRRRKPPRLVKEIVAKRTPFTETWRA